MGKRILFAWELGGGYGHVKRMLPIADGLTAAGHAVTLAVREPEATRRLLAGAAYPLLPAPAWHGTRRAGFIASSYAEMLQENGYGDTAALHALLAAWLERFGAVWPDLVVADFAPTAMLAARIAGLPVVALGNGYSLPPRRMPLPGMRPWAAIDPTALAATEATVLDCVNAALAGHHSAPLPALETLFAAEASFLCSFPELDHYADRGEADYYGVIYDGQTGEPPVWPTGGGERVFAYLNARHRPVAPLIEALDHLGLPSVLHAAGLAPAEAAALSRPSVRVTAAPVQVAAAVDECDIVVCQGIGTVAAALVAGRPVLVLPAYVEQMMTLHRVVQQGFGHGVPIEADGDAMAAALRRLLDDAACRRQAANFRRAYTGYRPSLATAAITEEMAALPVLG